MNLKKIYKRSKIYLLSFCIPFVVMIIAYMINGIFPGSEKTTFISDMGAQYVGFYSYLRYIGQGFNTIMYQTMGALGGGYFGTWAYYTSDPLCLMVLLFDPVRLSDAIYFLTIIKISLCGTAFSLFLKNGHLKIDDPFVVLISSASYALMSFNIVYSLNAMWLSGSIFLPLVILGIDWILESKRRELFIISLALSVMINYYTAYMIVLFCIVYYLYRSFCDPYKFKRFLRHALELFLCGILSALISVWLWLPVLIDLAKGKFSEGSKSYYGLIRTLAEVLRQFLPFSFSGITGKDSPPLYCGLLVTAFFIIYLFNKKISVRRRITSLIVMVFFFLSMLFNALDVVWHCFRMPNGFPGRYSFVISFFVIMLFAENLKHMPKSDKNRVSCIVKFAIGAFVAIDLVVNSAYSIYSLDHDRIAGGYLKSENYIEYFRYNEIYKAYGYTYPGRVASYLDFSHVDGFLYGIPSLDYYSSSYNYGVSRFFNDLGMNSIFHYSADSGITPVAASVLNVNGAVSYNDINEYSLLFDMFDPVYVGEDIKFYGNPYEGSLGYVYKEDTYSALLSGDVFENLNNLYHDFTGEDVFIKCEREDKDVTPLDKNIAYAKEIIIHPEKGMHLFVYISPDDYYANDMQGCNDFLYFEEALVAYYTDAPDRYIIDLGYSDGSVLDFTFETDNYDNEIYFYSFDDVLFEESVGKLRENGLYDVEYSASGIDASVTTDEDAFVALFMPYEPGYTITVDGKTVDYGSYADCVISIPVAKGTHDIHISYCTPGLKAAVFLSFIGIVILIFYEILVNKKIKKANI